MKLNDHSRIINTECIIFQQRAPFNNQQVLHYTINPFTSIKGVVRLKKKLLTINTVQ